MLSCNQGCQGEQMKSNVPENSSEATCFPKRGYLLRDGWIPLVFCGAFTPWRFFNLATLLPCILWFSHIFGYLFVLWVSRVFGDSPASPFRNLCFFSWGEKMIGTSELWGTARKMAKWLKWLSFRKWGTEFPPQKWWWWWMNSISILPGPTSQLNLLFFLDHIHPPPFSSGHFCVDDFLSAMHGYRCGWGEIVEVAGRVRFSGLAKAWEKFWCFWSVNVAPKFSMDTKKWLPFSKFSF